MYPDESELRGRMPVSNVLLWFFAMWPLFWTLWTCIRITAAISPYIPALVLIVLGFVSFFVCGKLRMSFLFVWTFFIVAAMLSALRGMTKVGISDILIIFCGVLFCYGMQRTSFDPSIIFRCIYACGMFVSITVIIDAVTNIFSTKLLSLYTSNSQEVLLKRLTGIATGGIVTQTSGAGCFICAALGVYCLVLFNKKARLKNIFVLSVLLVSYVLLLKRGFILFMIAAGFVVLLCERKRRFSLRVKHKKIFRIVSAFLLLLLVAIVLYKMLPLVRDKVDALVSRFTEEDETLSGRTTLYALAYDLFKTNPVFGIGWGMFRGQTQNIFGSSYTNTYEVHNVYLQLLCETGIIGVIAFLVAVSVTLLVSIKKYRCLVLSGVRTKVYYACRLGIYLQVFFLAYCVTGNPLYDYNHLIMYFIGVVLSVSKGQMSFVTGGLKGEDRNSDIL